MESENISHNRRAVVIGGSMGGLMAARVLSDFYDEVVIVERDDLSVDGVHRRGVPQGRHAHALLAAGQRVIEDLFPGISDELLASGAISADPLADGTWFFEGGSLMKVGSGSTGVLISRPALEHIIRRRVRRIDGVEFRDAHSIRKLLSSDGRITGVTSEAGPIAADLVVDATGRGSRAGKWLADLGFEKGRKEKIGVDLVYSTRRFRPGSSRIGRDEKFAVVAPTPFGKRGGVMSIQEDGSWIVTLFGHFGHVPPGDLAGFREYAKSLPSRVIYNAIRNAEPIAEATHFRFPASTRRYYEKLNRFPDGFLVFGDAICSFNPIYGQGMSSAALQAKELQDILRHRQSDLARRFFKRAAIVIANPWSIAVGSDLKMPETTGPRTIAVRLINRYIANVHKQAHTDPITAIAFTRVSQMLAPPESLMHPKIVVRVLLGIVRRKFGSGRTSVEKLMTTSEPSRQT